MNERDYDALEAAERADMAMGDLSDKIARLERIEAAAREMFALDKGGFTNVDEFELKYEVLRLLVKPK